MEWREIDGYERYLVSDDGRVVNGDTGNLLAEEVVKGYHRVELWKGNRRKHEFVHRLVASAFIPNPLCLPEVNHINGNKSDNSVGNLEWCTGEQNISHAIETGLIKARPICVGGNRYRSKAEAARALGVSVQTISEALSGERISCIVKGKPVYYEGEAPREDRPRKKRTNTRGWHRSVPTEGKHVFVDGIEYISIAEAARAIGVAPKSLRYSLSDDCISGRCKGHAVWYADDGKPREPMKPKHAGGKPKKKVMVDGIVFDSTADAARYLCVNRRTMMGYVKDGKKYEGREITVL